MSHSQPASALSLGINDLAGAQYLESPKRIPQPRFFNKVDLPIEHALQFVAHLDPVPQAEPCVFPQREEHVDVALTREILPNDRSKNGEAAHLPSPAEIGNGIHGNCR